MIVLDEPIRSFDCFLLHLLPLLVSLLLPQNVERSYDHFLLRELVNFRSLGDHLVGSGAVKFAFDLLPEFLEALRNISNEILIEGEARLVFAD